MHRNGKIAIVKPKYYDRKTAPLIYYKILRVVLSIGVIIGTITEILSLISVFAGTVFWLAFAEKLVFLVLEAFALDGLIKLSVCRLERIPPKSTWLLVMK